MMINEPRCHRDNVFVIVVVALIFFSHRFVACGEAKDQAAIEKGIQALVALKDGDEDGFDSQADLLIKAGADALPLLEAKQKALTGKQAFLLQRVRDMIIFPSDVRGVITTRVRDSRIAESIGITVFTIITSFNGTPVTDENSYIDVRTKAQKAGTAVAVLETISKGRKQSVKVPGLQMGVNFKDYPNSLVEYLHRGHRSEIWDEEAKEGLKMRLQDWRGTAADRLAKALEKGANDPLLLICAMYSYIDMGAPEQALGLWRANSGKVDSRLYGGKFVDDLQVRAAECLVQTGDSAGAIKVLEPLVKNTALSAALKPQVRGLLALTIEDSDPKRAEALYKEAAAEQKGPFWNECLIHLLKKQKRWDEVAALAGMYEDRIAKATLAWVGKLKAVAEVKPVEHWALVYRQNFDVDKAGGYISAYHPNVLLEIGASVSGGKFRIDCPASTGISTWCYYGDCRAEVDVQIERAPDRFGWAPPAISLTALEQFTTRNGTGLKIGPRRISESPSFDQSGFSYYAPSFDHRKEHHLALECNKGKVTSSIDGQDVNVTFVPPDWYGVIGLGMWESLATYDNFEIYRPIEAEVDNKKARDSYDSASAAFNKGDLKAALGFLEQAATISNDDLARLYVAYMKAAGLSRQEASKLIHERLAQATTETVFWQVLLAEIHVELLYLDQPEYDAARDVWISGLEYKNGADEKHVQQMKDAHDCGRLFQYTLYVLSRYRLHQKTFADVEAAFRHAMAQDPSSVNHPFALAQFYLREKKPELVAPLIRQVMEKAPAAKFLEKMLPDAGNDGKAVKPPAPPSGF